MQGLFSLTGLTGFICVSLKILQIYTNFEVFTKKKKKKSLKQVFSRIYLRANFRVTAYLFILNKMHLVEGKKKTKKLQCGLEDKLDSLVVHASTVKEL